jgi:hypothetical protein
VALEALLEGGRLSFMAVIKFLASAVVFTGMDYLFVKNLIRAGKSGEINNRGDLIRRSESQVYFWLVFSVYGVCTAFAAAAAEVSVIAIFVT